MSQYLTVRVPAETRDADGVRFDAMLQSIGAEVVRELPRPAAGEYVELLVEHSSAPEHLRGRVVTAVVDEVDGELSFDRWELAAQ